MDSKSGIFDGDFLMDGLLGLAGRLQQRNIRGFFWWFDGIYGMFDAME